MSKDIFDELEKSIDDAFKPEEKEKVKKTLWDHYSTPTHNHKVNDDYMRNRVYDELMFGPHTHTRPNYMTKQYKCNCGCTVTLWLEEDEGFMSAYRYASDAIPYEQNINVTNCFCSMCGEMFRYYGKVKKVFTEVN